MSLRSKVIRLAHANPELRPQLLPLVTAALRLEPRQELIWMPPQDGWPMKAPWKFGPGRPLRLWSLPKYDKESHPPQLPYQLKHGTTAYVDNFMDDYQIKGGELFYYSHYISKGDLKDQGIWLLAEFRA